MYAYMYVICMYICIMKNLKGTEFIAGCPRDPEDPELCIMENMQALQIS